jgi:hypothetical protein
MVPPRPVQRPLPETLPSNSRPSQSASSIPPETIAAAAAETRMARYPRSWA